MSLPTLLPTPCCPHLPTDEASLERFFRKTGSVVAIVGGIHSRKAARVHPGRLAVLLLARLLEGGGEFIFFFFLSGSKRETWVCEAAVSLSPSTAGLIKRAP